MQGNKRTLIIAEVGVNHDGSLEKAKRLVEAAAEAGADIVKFQTFRTEALVSRQAPMAGYQIENLAARQTQFQMLKALELSYEDFRALAAYCARCHVAFLSTAFDLASLEFLESLSPEYIKIPSGEITNLPYLEAISALQKKVILSTGMCELDEVDAALKILKGGGTRELTLMHCSTEYPTPPEDVNLRAMNTLAETFGCPVGYSDHTQGLLVPVAAVARGAAVIEKHLTLNRGDQGPDHRASAEPELFAEMVRQIRQLELALGSPVKRPTATELENRTAARKSIWPSREIQAGERFSADNLCVKRPGTGLSPMLWRQVIGQAAKKNYAVDEVLAREDFV